MNNSKDYVCIVCPNGCPLHVELTDGDKPQFVSVSGNLCPRGAKWARQEIETPMRTISTNVLVEGGDLPVVSVRTADPIPLSRIMDVRAALRGITLKAPLKVGDIVTEEPAGIKTRVIVTRNICAKA